MTHPALVAVLVVMAGLLGAASLAIFLLYRGWKSNRAQITELKAQVATQQIAALTGVNKPPLPTGEPPAPEPARRRRHLALYIGGGVAAVYTTCRDSVRNLLRTRPVLTTAAVATVATVGTAAALILVPGDSADTDAPAPSTASTGQPSPGPTPPPSAQETSGVDPDSDVEPDSGEVLAIVPPLLQAEDQAPGEETPGGQTPAPGTTPAEDAAKTPGGRPSGGSGPTAGPPAPGPDAPGTVQPPPDDPPDTGPEPGPPSTGAPEQPSSPDTDDGGLCVKLPPLVDLCLLDGL